MCCLRWTSWSLFVLLPAGFASAQEVEALVQLPAGLADPMGRTGILANTTGGLDVIDLATGELLWETKEAQRPLLVLGQRLYAQAAVGKQRLRLLAFDLAERGACVVSSEPVTFPDWVSIQEAPGRSFSADWQRDRNRLVLTWQAAAWNGAGPALFRLTGQPAARAKRGKVAFLPGQVDKLEASPSRQQAAGRAAFDLETGKVELLPFQPAGPVAPIQPPHDATKLATRWQGTFGGNFTALTLDSARDQSALVLRVWDRVTGKQAAPRELLRGRRPVVLPSVDGRFLCLRDVPPSPDQRLSTVERANQYGWSVFAPETGHLVARLPFEPGTQAVALAGPRAYFLVAAPLRGSIDRPFVRSQLLKAVDAKSGKLLWQRPVEGKTCVPAAT